jgi:hypothetical protein
LGLLAPAARAQQNSLIGVWSAQGRSANGAPVAVHFWRFEEGGGFQHRMVVNPTQPGTPGSIVDYVGRYGFSPAQSLLQLVYLDYQPKQVCGSGFCNPIPPGVPLNQPISTTVRFQGQGRMMTQDANGPMIWVRQQ